MALKRYDVVVNGTRTTLQLSDEDAELYGLQPSDAAKPAEKSKTPANKARQPSNKQAEASGGGGKSEG